MKNLWAKWLRDMKKAETLEKELSGKLRVGTAVASLGGKVHQLQNLVSALEKDLKQLKKNNSNFDITEQELERRQQLLQQLKNSQLDIVLLYNNKTNHQANTSAPKESSPKSGLLTMQGQILKEQDDHLEKLSEGVANLRQYSMAIHEETDLHVKLLDDMDDDVSRATVGLESEGGRAERVSKSTNFCRLYVAIVILFITLILMIILGS